MKLAIQKIGRIREKMRAARELPERDVFAVPAYVLSFLIPVSVMLLIYCGEGFYPFGEKSLLTADMYGQYTCFISYFKDMWKNGNDIFYTFSKSLGGDMFGFTAYYLLSPFNLIAFFFDTRDLPQAMMLITLLKTGCAGLAFMIFARHETKDSPASLLFATGYVLMGFMFVYQQNILWLDAVIGLPIVMLGIHRLVYEKKPLLYAVSLGVCLAVNYYTGYIICLFSVIFFIYKAVSASTFPERGSFENFIFAAARFVVSSAIAVGLAAAVLLPTLLSLRGGDKNTSAMSNLTLDPFFRVPDLVPRLFSGSFENADLWSTRLPTVFCGMLGLGSAILFFLNRKIRIRERICGAAMIAVMTVSLELQGPYLLWHGFNYPVGFPYRHAFLLSFTLLYFGCRAVSRADGITLGRIASSLAVVGALALTAVIVAGENGTQTAQSMWGEMLIASVLALILAAAVAFPKMSYRAKSLCFAAALTLGTADMAQNGYVTLGRIDYYSQKNYVEFIDEVGPVIDRIKSEDTDFYRVEKTFQRDHNDPMLLSYRGLSHFSSTEKTATKKFLERMGLRNNGNWVYYDHGTTIAAESLLGVRYLLAKTAPNAFYEPLFTEGGITVYENPFALPLGFMASGDADGVTAPVSPAFSTDTVGDPFAYQNSIFSAMTGIERGVYTRVEDVEMTLDGLTSSGDKGRYIKTGFGTAEFTFTADTDDPIYLFMPARGLKTVRLYIDGDLIGPYLDYRNYGIMYLGQFSPGQEVTLTLLAVEKEVFFEDAYFYRQNMDVTAEVFESLASEPFEITSFTSSHISGTVTSSDERTRLITTIPADDGWSVRVDGKKVTPVRVFDALWSVELAPGAHTVEWRYTPPGLIPGVCVTVLAAAVIAVWSIFAKKNAQR